MNNTEVAPNPTDNKIARVLQKFCTKSVGADRINYAEIHIVEAEYTTLVNEGTVNTL